jgi:hypothetical protein
MLQAVILVWFNYNFSKSAEHNSGLLKETLGIEERRKAVPISHT